MFKDYDRYLARFGEKKALRLCRALVRNYNYVSYLDTGVADAEEMRPLVLERANLLDLEETSCDGTIRVLRKLFSGPWDDEFVIVPPGGRLTDEPFFPGPPVIQPM